MQASTPRHRLVFMEEDHQHMRDQLFKNSEMETAAVVFARGVKTPLGGWRLLVSEVMHPAEEDHLERTATRIDLRPEFVNRVFEKAHATGQSVFWTHTHPGDLLEPSGRDLAGEKELLPRLKYHSPGVPHGRLIYTTSGLHARLFLPEGHEAPLEVQGVGQTLEQHTAPESPLGEQHHRQILAFGEEGQKKLQHLQVAVVGAGGTGSLALQQLAHLGVQDFCIFDPDTIDHTNLNRVVGTTPKSKTRSKTEVAHEMVLSINPDANVTVFNGDITRHNVNRHLLDCDFFLACTDSHGSREVLSRICYQYFLPGIDIGVGIHRPEPPHRDLQMVGRVQMLSPGLSCLLCREVLDPMQVLRDLQTEQERQANPYFAGEGPKQPAVISLNSTVVGLGISMFLAAITGIPIQARYQQVMFNRGVVHTPAAPPVPNCPHCSGTYALGQGDLWQRPGRP